MAVFRLLCATYLAERELQLVSCSLTSLLLLQHKSHLSETRLRFGVRIGLWGKQIHQWYTHRICTLMSGATICQIYAKSWKIFSLVLRFCVWVWCKKIFPPKSGVTICGVQIGGRQFGECAAGSHRFDELALNQIEYWNHFFNQIEYWSCFF